MGRLAVRKMVMSAEISLAKVNDRLIGAPVPLSGPSFSVGPIVMPIDAVPARTRASRPRQREVHIMSITDGPNPTILIIDLVQASIAAAIRAGAKPKR